MRVKVPKLETQRLVQVYYKIRYYKGLLKIKLLDQITGWEVEMEQNTLLSSRLRNPRPLQKRCTPNTQGTSSPLPLDISSSRLHHAYNRCIILIGISFYHHLLIGISNW